jgi:hypothetical protein
MTLRARCLSACLAAAVVIAPAAQTTTFVQVGSIAGPADLIEVQGKYAYIASGKTLTIIDVGDPAAPKRAGSYTFPELIWGFTLAGDIVYVAADTYGLGILDVASPATPVLRASLRTPGQAKSVAVASNRAFVADHVRGIDVVSLSPAAGPALVTSYFVDGFAKDVVVRGNVLYAIDQPTGLNLFDLSKPAVLDPAGTLSLRSAIPLRAQLDVSDASAPARLAVVVGGGPIQIYDVTNATAPKAVTMYRTPGAAQRVSLQGTDLYVADGPAGLQMVDLSSPLAPVIKASFKTGSPARDVAVAGPLVFVVSGGEEVLILRRQAD